ncbi:Alpha/Beta hydrolase protein [Aspergillus undulatus]|uniref:Alpha/Beta hydrolase protein n=1 Tax=Aspergillus undulatus TaxID=1810928 RepID=UPI003CCE2F35
MLLVRGLLRLVAFGIIVRVGVAVHSTPSQRPVVDLGYEIYRATEESNSSADYYTFSNIRYAAPPLDSLRWREPAPPRTNRSLIQSNSGPITCPQATPSWQIRTSPGVNEYLGSGIIPNISYAGLSSLVKSGQEDCLFLDVVVPKDVFDGIDSGGVKVPVLVWIHGGGFTAGSKTSFGSPEGLLSRGARSSSNANANAFLYVALNYRLGAFGFLAGASFKEQGGILNAGLLDQRMALHWIQENIHRFGVDKDQVTVFGESGGGGSIMHHITAGAGRNKSFPPLFNRAIPQSPAHFPYRSPEANENAFASFLRHANASTLAQARALPEDILVSANARSIGGARPYASPVYGPSPDGALILSDPKTHLRRGEFHRGIQVLTGHNSNEGLVLVRAIHTSEEYTALLGNILTGADAHTIDYIAESLYPPIFDGTKGTAGDAIINCNAVSLGLGLGLGLGPGPGLGFGARARAYLFSTHPGLHAQDRFYNPGSQLPSPSYSLVDTGADYIVAFATTGEPVSALDGLPEGQGQGQGQGEGGGILYYLRIYLV